MLWLCHQVLSHHVYVSSPFPIDPRSSKNAVHHLRQLVFRVITKAVKPDEKEADEQEMPPISPFAIESNRIRQLNELPHDRDIETEEAAFLETSQEAHEQDDVLIGFRSPQ